MPACTECERLRDTYSNATIRYLNFYSGSRPMSEETDREGNWLKAEMQDASARLMQHQVDRHARLN